MLELKDIAPAHETWIGDTLDAHANGGDPNPAVLEAVAHWLASNGRSKRFAPALQWLADNNRRPLRDGDEGSYTYSWQAGDGGSPHTLPAEAHAALEGQPYKSGRLAYLAAVEALLARPALMKAASNRTPS